MVLQGVSVGMFLILDPPLFSCVIIFNEIRLVLCASVTKYLSLVSSKAKGYMCVAFAVHGGIEIHVLNSATELVDTIVIGYNDTEMQIKLDIGKTKASLRRDPRMPIDVLLIPIHSEPSMRSHLIYASSPVRVWLQTSAHEIQASSRQF